MEELTPQDTICIRKNKDIKEICNKLFSSSKLTYFCFVRRFRNNAFISLCSNQDWQVFFHEKKYYSHNPVYEYKYKFDYYETSTKLWLSMDNKDPVFEDEAKLFNIGNGITLIEKQRDYCDFFHFGAPVEDIIVLDFYNNNMETLKKFNLYFKDKTKTIIKECLSHKLFVAKPIVSELENKNPLISVNKHCDFYDEINRYILDNNVILTKKDVCILRWISQGKSAEEIALITGAAKRTIECRLTTIKDKTGYHKNTQLVEYALRRFLL